MIVIGVTILIPICMLVVGAVYFDDCPAESHIPIYLIVGGTIFAINSTAFYLLTYDRSNYSTQGRVACWSNSYL